MKWNTFIQRYADIRLDERKPVSILFLHSFLLGFSTAFFFVAANSYFIKKVTVTDIPYAYIIAGILGFLMVQFFKYLIQKLGSVFSYFGILILFALTCFTLFIGHSYLDDKATSSLILAYTGFILIFPFSGLFVLGFSGICLQLFNLLQNKRLLALIGIGEVLASIVGYLAVPVITRFTNSVVQLFFISGIFILLAILPIWYIYKLNANKFTVKSHTKTPIGFTFSIFKKDTFYKSLAIVTFFSVMAVYFSDYAYLVSVRSLTILTGIEIANIIAALFCIIKTGELLFSFFSSNIISTKGMKFSLLLLPFILVLFSALSVFSFLIFNDVLFFIVVFFLMAKWSDRVLRKGVYTPATKVLYQVAEPHERIQVQTNIEGTISQLSIILSGIILVVVSKLQPNTNSYNFIYTMAFISLAFSVMWFIFVWFLYSHYKTKIHTYLHKIQNINTTSQANTQDKLFNQWLNHKENLLSETEKHLAQQTYQSIGLTDNIPTNKLEAFIAFYNPSLTNFLHQPDKEILNKQIIRLYYSNNNFFSRVLIIFYLKQNHQLTKFTILYELYEAADFEIKKIIVSSLNQLKYKASNNDSFYFYELCKVYVEEIIWCELAIDDIKNSSNKTLPELLEIYNTNCKNHLLDILKILYGNDAIHVVQQILNETNKATEGNIFAVELLDNILQPKVKEKVIPIFEPIPQHLRWSKLEKFCNIYHLSAQERIKEILGRNYKFIPVYIKQEALVCYNNMATDKNVIHAFSTSLLEEMKALSNKLMNYNYNDFYFIKQKLIAKLNLDLYFSKQQLQNFSQFAIVAANAKVVSYNHSSTEVEYYVKVETENKEFAFLDLIGMSLLFKLQQKQED